MRKGVQIPDWIPEAYIIHELVHEPKDLRDEIELGYPLEEDPHPPQEQEKEEERVIIIKL